MISNRKIFFLCVTSGLTALFTTDSLSQNIEAGQFISTPIILSLYLTPIIFSMARFSAMYSDPIVEDSTVFWRLLSNTIRALLKDISIPVWERRVTLFPTGSASRIY